jgi:hypothetical protein
MVHCIKLPLVNRQLMKKSTTKLSAKIILSHMHQLNVNAMKCHLIYLSQEQSVKTFGMELAIHTMLMTGKDLLNNSEHIMFMKLF